MLNNDWYIDFKIKMLVVGCRIILWLGFFFDRIILFMYNQNIIIYLNIFNSNTYQNVVNSTVINTKVPYIIIFNMFYYVLYKYEL